MRRVLIYILGGFAALALGLAVNHLRLATAAGPPPKAAESLRIASYNVHYIVMNWETGRWSVGDFERRKGPMDATFKALDTDLIAFQEMESFRWGGGDGANLARDWLLAENPSYGAAAVGPVEEYPSTQPIFYRKDRLEPVEQTFFFFSETPDVIYSRTFNGSFPAFASVVQFRDLTTGALFRVINIHTDYASRENRRRSIDLVAERAAPWIAAGETVFLVGDFNALWGSRLQKRLEREGFSFLRAPKATFHFDRGLHLFAAIDHIAFFGAARPVASPMVFQKKLGAAWPTDHYPLLADFMLGE
ncbi:MAG: endonuclease/exonuclease/phosphatase family protein [Pseudomonadota bacterium]